MLIISMLLLLTDEVNNDLSFIDVSNPEFITYCNGSIGNTVNEFINDLSSQGIFYIHASISDEPPGVLSAAVLYYKFKERDITIHFYFDTLRYINNRWDSTKNWSFQEVVNEKISSLKLYQRNKHGKKWTPAFNPVYLPEDYGTFMIELKEGKVRDY